MLEHRFKHCLRRVRVAVAAPRQAGLLPRREGVGGLGDAFREALVADGLVEFFFFLKSKRFSTNERSSSLLLLFLARVLLFFSFFSHKRLAPSILKP